MLFIKTTYMNIAFLTISQNLSSDLNWMFVSVTVIRLK